MDHMAAMRAFVRVVEVGTFTRAAQLLNVPKPTLSKLIQGLEAHLRTRLLNRTTRRVTVTADGAAYYERVIGILADVDELDGSMTLSQASPKGKLRIDVGTSLALLIIIPALPDFHARYPDIQIDLGVSDRPVDLLSENVDCVLRGAVVSGALRRAASPLRTGGRRSRDGGLFQCGIGTAARIHLHARRRAA